MKNLGYALIAIGALAVLIAFGYDTAPEGTHNIGLIQSQSMLMMLGAVLAVIGSIVGTGAHILSRMQDAGILPPPGSKPVASVSSADNGQGEA